MNRHVLLHFQKLVCHREHRYLPGQSSSQACSRPRQSAHHVAQINL